VRDVGIAIWVVLLIVGVVGSMASKLRGVRAVQSPAPDADGGRIAAMRALRARGYTFEQARAATEAAPAAASPAPPQVSTPPVAARTRPAASVRAAPREAAPTERSEATGRFRFPGRSELVRAVIAAEVLGKPRGLSDEYFPNL
jgi:hypothetical protein